jgi:glucose-1-phosphate cytidylyltransferase
MDVHHQNAEPWKVTLIDTGDSTQTGGRLRRVSSFIKDEASFCFTYGDGVGNVDIRSSIEFHESHGKLATVTAVHPPGRYGALECSGAQVTGFAEKPRGDGAVINGGFFILSPKVIDYIDGDQCVWEGAPMSTHTRLGELMAFEHNGFWQPMDTLREKNLLEDLWASGEAPWKTWK